ncbi:MAG: hypothetical protein ACRETD_07935, partial [Steroidobacteraceae bacterium]
DTLRVMEESIVGTGAGAWREVTVRDPAGRESIIRWRYRIGGRTFVRPLASQLWYGMTSFTTQPLSSLLALRALCEPGCQDARGRLEAAASRLQPILHITEARQGRSST